MSSYRQGPSLTSAIVAVYVAGSLSSFLWDLAGVAVVGSGQYLDARPSAFLAIAWRIGGVVATSVLAALVVKAILDLEGGAGVSYARSFAALLAGNMAGTLAFLALPYLGQEGASNGSGGNLVLMAVVLHWLGFVLSIAILLGAPDRRRGGARVGIQASPRELAGETMRTFRSGSRAPRWRTTPHGGRSSPRSAGR